METSVIIQIGMIVVIILVGLLFVCLATLANNGLDKLAASHDERNQEKIDALIERQDKDVELDIED